MTPLWFLNLVLKCIDLFSWPLLALGYPLCASIQAIESDSHSDTRNLISYWILLSLIYLFEYAFHMLLQWFRYWAYIKLMIIVWLMIPDFGRASYVYNCLVYSCISMNPQEVISRFTNSKEKSFLMQTEKYITENGSEALEKLIASKNQTAQNLDAEGMKAVPATEKNEMQQTNKVRLDVEQKDIKDLEMIEMKEVPESKQGNTAATNHELNVNISSATVQIDGTAGEVIADREFLESCASKNVQQEWTCAMCQVTTTCKSDLRSHRRGSKHKATLNALKAKNQQPGKMKDIDSAGRGRGQNNNKAAKFCDYCNTPGHVRELCFHLNGYPDWYLKYKAQKENANMPKTETSKRPLDFPDDSTAKQGSVASILDGLQQELGKIKGKVKGDGHAVNLTRVSEFIGNEYSGPED